MGSTRAQQGPHLEVVPGVAPQVPVATGSSSAPELSADGHWALFVSSADNLADVPVLPFITDLYARDLVAKTNYLLSISVNGASGADKPIEHFSITPDGQWALFSSAASNLVPDDTNDVSDVFVRRIPHGPTLLASVSSNALLRVPFMAQGSARPTLSDDGRFVAFETDLALLSEDTNLLPDVYLRDLVDGTLTWVSKPIRNTTSGRSLGATISGDGRFVAFENDGVNLVPNPDANQGATDVFIYDRVANSNRLASATPSGSSGNRFSELIGLSRNGSVVIFMSQARDLAAGSVPLSATDLLHVRDLEAGRTVRFTPPDVSPSISTAVPEEVGLTPDGRYAIFILAGRVFRWDWRNNLTVEVVPLTTNVILESLGISDDGNRVIFAANVQSTAPLTAGAISQVLLRDIAAEKLDILSRNSSSGLPGASQCFYPVISGDGTVAAFESSDGDLLPGDQNSEQDCFAVRLETGTLEWISAPGGMEATPSIGTSSILDVSADGSRILLISDAQLVADDTNHLADAYLYEMDSVPKRFRLVSARPQGGSSADGDVTLAAMSRDGKKVVFTSKGTDFGINDTNALYDVFLRDVDVETTMPLSTNLTGSAMGNGGSIHPYISASGSVVAYESASNDLVEGDSSSLPDLFVHNQTAGTRFSPTVAGHPASDSPLIQALSPTGKYLVARWSRSANIYNLEGGSVIALPNALGNSAVFTSVSEDTALFDLVTTSFRGVASYEFATGLTNVICTNCATGKFDDGGRFLSYRDLQNRLVRYDLLQKVATDFSSATPAADVSFFNPQLGGNGARAVFVTRPNHPAEIGPKYGQVYFRDIAAGLSRMLSATPTGEPGNYHSLKALISEDGKVVVFQSYATDLIEPDENDRSDIFIYRVPESAPDTDGDGLPDEWEITYFNNLAQTAEGDPDADGANNLSEWRAGTNPSLAASLLHIQRLEAVFSQKVVLVWQATPGKVYRVQHTDDVAPANWADLGAPVPATAETASAELGTADQNHRFYRVRLE